MHYLVTGGAGFIGSHLCEHLLEAGCRVTIVDNFSTGRRENISRIQDNPACAVVTGDVCDPAILKEVLRFRPEMVIHLAAAVGVRTIIEHPLRSLKTNIEGTLNVLDAALSAGKCPVIIASTSEVYGKNDNIPFAEENDIVLGSTATRRWGYACSKALDEFLGLAYFSEHGLPVTIVRLFNTIGPRQTGRYGMVVPRFIEQAFSGRAITVYGDGRQTRCFTYVSDVTGAIIRISTEHGLAGNVFNIGTREEIAIIDLARKIKTLCRSKSSIQNIPPEKVYADAGGFEDMRRRVPDLSRVEQAIGYRPQVTLDEALRKIIEDFRG